ncbi:hypothetical protein [Paraburkholderia sp. J12]|uniref:hypothetical protein n=1 Tax=Paraburkholderia sp. J12 TaxID=2805432 RepID=UPI002ABDBF2C|nr:hypothetical protein [Paraburkholderia sp. J12]
MKYRLRILQILLALMCGVILCLHFWDDIWTHSVDLAHHYALVARLTEFGNLPHLTDPSLGEMQIYPRMSHRIAAALGHLWGSPLAGMQFVAFLSTIVLWVGMGWMLWTLPLSQARRATWILLLGLLVGGLFMHVDFWGMEVVYNYFYAQFVAQAAALVVLALALGLSQAGVSRFAVYSLLIAGIWVVESIHLLPAVELLGFLGLLVVFDQYWQVRKWDWRNLLISAAFPVVALLVVVVNPVFRAMATISENDGVLYLSFVPDQLALLALVLLVAISSILAMRCWLGLKDPQLQKEQLLIQYFAIFGLSIAILCSLQMIALAIGRGSEYACRKYAFGLWTVLLVNASLLLAQRFGSKQVAKPGLTTPGKIFDYCAVGIVVTVAVLAMFPKEKYLSLSNLVSMEHRLEAIKSSQPTTPAGTSTYAVQLPGEPPLVDYMFSLGVFKSARSANTIDVLENRDLSLADQIGLIVTGKEISRYDTPECRLRSPDATLTVIDGPCYAKSMPNRRFCRGEMHLTDSRFLQGFSWPEEQGTWTDNKVATFHCDMPEHLADYPESIRISGFAFVPSTHVQHVGISINGGVPREFMFDSSTHDQSMVLPVPPGASSIQIKFLLPDAVSPNAMGVSADMRELGLYVKSILLLGGDGKPI